MKRSYFPLLLAIACGGSPIPPDTSSLEGPLGFQPNSSVVVLSGLTSNVIFTSQAEIELVASTPRLDCGLLDAGAPANGVETGEVSLQLGQQTGIKPGTFNVTDYKTFSSSTLLTPLAYLRVGGPGANTLATSFSGTVTITKADTEWAGNFNVMLLSFTDGGQTSLSGSFDTSQLCVEVL